MLNKGNKHNYFEIATDDIVRFCELVINTSPSEHPYSTFEPGTIEGKINFVYKDDPYDKDVTMSFDISGNTLPVSFQFDPKIILPFFKNLPYETVSLSALDSGKMYNVFSKEDEGFMGLIMGVIS